MCGCGADRAAERGGSECSFAYLCACLVVHLAYGCNKLSRCIVAFNIRQGRGPVQGLERLESLKWLPKVARRLLHGAVANHLLISSMLPPFGQGPQSEEYAM